MSTQHKTPVLDMEVASSHGFDHLCDTEFAGHSFKVFERQHPNQACWQYWLAATDRQGVWRLLNQHDPLEAAPHVVDMGRLLRRAGLTRKRSFACGDECAINVDGINEHEGNFTCMVLCNRAVGELLLEGELGLDADEIITFHVDRDANESHHRTVSLKDWFKAAVDHDLRGRPVLLLAAAAAAGDAQRVRDALQAGAPANVVTGDSERTVLHVAARYGHETTVAALLAHGADVQARDRRGMRPLHEASFHGHAGVVHQLQEAGADVLAADDLGRRPLDMAQLHPQVQGLLRSMAARRTCDEAAASLPSGSVFA